MLISNCPTSISVSQISVRPTKHAEISGVLEITIPANIATDRIKHSYTMGKTAATLLIEQLENKSNNDHSVVIDSTLSQRASS